MTNILDSVLFRDMFEYGFSNLYLHRDIVDDLNVFPVPDGDTGTNMVLTLQSGLHALDESNMDLPVALKKFSNAVTLSARGNSGVIVSQFFRGVSDYLMSLSEINSFDLSHAFEHGVETAYNSVSHPVEGTILTVLREGSEAVLEAIDTLKTIDDVIAVFLSKAKISLQNTPNLLPVLKEAGVVDSGAAGLVYIFEGFAKYLNGDSIDTAYTSDEKGTPEATQIDYSLFNSKSEFPYGYCTELLIQLLDSASPFDFDSFRSALNELGESIVISQADDKVKLHIHTHYPENVFTFCHQYGEFLALKVENMSVQHSELEDHQEPSVKECGTYAVVAVSPDAVIGDMLSDMGADSVIICKGNPSSQDYLNAFKSLHAKNILVFPNNPNSVLAAYNASNLYTDASVVVIECKSVAECYAVLPMLDYSETDMDSVLSLIYDTIAHIDSANVSCAVKDSNFGSQEIRKGNYIGLSGKELLAVAETPEQAAVQVAEHFAGKRDINVITVFCGLDGDPDLVEEAFEPFVKEHLLIEIQIVPTENTTSNYIISFE